MTLGNSQPPLTRRQAREAAQALEHAHSVELAGADESVVEEDERESATAETKASEATGGRKSRAAQKRRGAAKSVSAGESARQTATALDDAPPSIPVETAPPKSVPVPASETDRAARASDAASASGVDETSATRALTRRELRALNASADADARELASDVLEERALDDTIPAPESADAEATADADAEATADADAAADADASNLHPPVGHWSIDAGDDETPSTGGPTQSLDDLISLGVGAGGIPTTTNALILPSIPNHGTTSGPLTTTGEVMITGSFDLPRSLGETGQHPNHFDSADVDQMNEQLDEFGSSDNAPVSASRAVSTHASTRNVMTPPKKRGLSLPAVLVVSTAALAVSVGALLFVGHLLQIF
ncbi:hypothetical protein JF66_08555 [Cryobacterium sp. MLB-32]|uniref:hypothetical protein n=1 Tax=Cryobacterium sp. MLB-32 TaxID=1529318 RepID=UPI0004E6405B|nr:hypothetical protein [Cryobacterium sp. MLB-32]KFF59847.1 hypothetical protein JF66_08555 [Cryobacterium sp. MLB-32]